MSKLILATSNNGKLKEVKELMAPRDVVCYSACIEPFVIEETGSTFAQNARIKAESVYKALRDEKAIVIADDSGICVDALGGEPGIYSARYAREGARDEENLQKLINELKRRDLTFSSAHYTAAIVICCAQGIFTTHGCMYGRVTVNLKGEHGFGYDPMFIPEGYDRTCAQLSDEEKNAISHRYHALWSAKRILDLL